MNSTMVSYVNSFPRIQSWFHDILHSTEFTHKAIIMISYMISLSWIHMRHFMTYELMHEFLYMKNIVKSYLKLCVPRFQMYIYAALVTRWLEKHNECSGLVSACFHSVAFWPTKGLAIFGLSALSKINSNQPFLLACSLIFFWKL